MCPATDSVQAGGTATLTATVANTANAAVAWEVNGLVGGNATVGTITSAGVYSAPASVPSPATVTIKETGPLVASLLVESSTRSSTGRPRTGSAGTPS